jgi:hypothetical protein
MTLLMIRPRRIAIITAEMGVFSKPIRLTPMYLLNQMLSQASKAGTSEPGSCEGISLTVTPNKFFSKAFILRAGRAAILLFSMITSSYNRFAIGHSLRC